MLRRVIARSFVSIAIVVVAVSIVQAEEAETASGICFTGCLVDCSPSEIMTACSQLCEDATGGVCGEHPMCINSSYLICDGRVS